MAKEKNKTDAHRKQVKSLDPKDDAETNSEFYGDERNISSQIITNFFFNPRDFK